MASPRRATSSVRTSATRDSTSATAARPSAREPTAACSISSPRSTRPTTGSSAWPSTRPALPTIDTTIQHTYAAAGTYTAFIASCCRIQANAPPNAHINNPEFDYQVQAVVELGQDNASATTALPPIVTCPQDSVCSFLVPATDPDGDTLTFRLATPSEADGGRVQAARTPAGDERRQHQPDDGRLYLGHDGRDARTCRAEHALLDPGDHRGA